MNVFKKLKKTARSGFTMAEVLTVVAIIGILAGIAIPSILAVQRNLKMTELDNAARSIYVAAQNRLSELRTSGELKTVVDSGMTTSTLGGSHMGATAPEDYTEDEWNPSTFFYLSSIANTAEISKLLPPGSIEATLASGYYYIEYSAKTGMVYGVFYSDEAFSYDTGLPRDKGARRSNSPMLGYYGGSVIDYEELAEVPPPNFNIVNGEELYLTFDAQTGIDYLLVISDGTQEWKYSFPDSSAIRPQNIGGSVESYKVLLDSLADGMQFKTLFEDLTPGADLTITLTASKDGSVPVSVSKTANSLFAGVAEVGGIGKTATVIYARHLQNLDTGFSGVTDDIKGASLGGSIDWNAASVATDKFISINNTDLISFIGNGNTIKNLNAALFDVFAGTESAKKSISDVKLVNSKVSVTGGGNVGALVNTADYVVFSKCSVFAETPATAYYCAIESSGASYTGGLVGYASNSEIGECFAALTRIQAGYGNVGGLAGGVKDTVISSSYADTGYWNPASGQMEAAWNPSSGIILNSGTAGGLVGSVSGGAISNCYAIGNIKASMGTASGFAGSTADSADISSSYCVTTFEGGEASSENLYGFAKVSYGNACYFLKSSVSGTSADAKGATSYEDMTNLFGTNTNWTKAAVQTTRVYGRGNNEVLPFPRLKTMSHTGDWPDENDSMADGLYYYEKYDDGSYGFYSVIGGKAYNFLSDMLVVVEDGYAVVLSDGPASISAKSQWITTWTTDIGTDSGIAETQVTVGGETFGAYLLSPDKNVIKSTTNLLNMRAFYLKLTVTAGSNTLVYFFNPCFAKTAVNASVQPAEPNFNFEIRTARQLTLASSLTNYYGYEYGWQRMSYIQTRSIDFAKYDTKYATEIGYLPLGMNRFFSGTYDGGGNVITGLDIGLAAGYNNANGGVGLFGTIETGGVVRNVMFIADAVGRTVTDRGAGNRNVGSGPFVGTNRGTIENCAVSGFTIDVTGYAAGGFVGTNAGTIKNCSAANATFTGQSTGGSGTFTTTMNGPGIGGFVGTNSGTIISCYAQASLNANGKAVNAFACTNSGPISNSYAVAVNTSGEYIAAFANSASQLTNCIVFNGANLQAIKDMTAGNSAWGSATAANSHPYDASLSGGYYFPAVVKNARGDYVHYGNWPEREIEGVVYYYEKYSDGSYGYYPTLGGKALRNDLAVSEDGYALILPGNASTLQLQCRPSPSGTYKSVTFTAANSADGWETIENKTIYPITSTILSGVSTSTIFYEIRVDNESYYFNPDFAKTVIETAPTVNATAKTYEVRTARHIAVLGANAGLSPYSGHYYKSTYNQTRDIDFTTYGTAQTVTPIGGTTTATYFSGTYNYLGLFRYVSGTIKGINLVGAEGAVISNTASHTGSLLGAVSSTGIIQNCSVSNIAVKGTTYVGGFAAFVNGGKVSGCEVTGTTTVDGMTYVGGFVGYSYNAGTISSCKVTGSVTINGTDRVGGFVGYSSASSVVSVADSYVTGAIVNGEINVGGFVGENSVSSNENCYTSGVTVTGMQYVGGYVGTNSTTNSGSGTASIKNCYSVNATVTGTVDSVGGFVGYNNGNSNSGLCLITDCYSADATVNAPNKAGGFAGFHRSTSSSGATGTSHITNSYSTGATVNCTGNQAGGFVGSFASRAGGTVQISNCSASGATINGVNYVGGFAGNSENLSSGDNSSKLSIENCSASGSSISGVNYVGGFTGSHTGGWGSHSVSGCSSKDSTVNGSDYVGGFAGNSTVATTNSFADSLKVSGAQYVGGFVGNSVASITYSYAAGVTVSGTNFVGGFAGQNGSSSTGSPIRYCFADNSYFGSNKVGGSVTGTNAANLGGFVGSSSSLAPIEYCYAVTRFGSNVTGGGFAGVTGSSKITNSYCVTMDSNLAWVTTFAKTGTVSNCMAFNGANSEAIKSAYSAEPWGKADTAHSFPYNTALNGEAYPFPAILKNTAGEFYHYGNWPRLTTILAYYEEYQGGTVGYYAEYSSQPMLNITDAASLPADSNIGLLSDTLPVIGDGYALLVPAGNTPSLPNITNTGRVVTVANQDYTVYKLTSVTYSNASTFYTQLTVDGVNYWLNPNFAKTAINGASSRPSMPNPIRVRTARQLSNLGGNTDKSYWGSACSYYQERNIDFYNGYGSANAAYRQTLHRLGTGSGSNAFAGTYDGGCYIITGAGYDSPGTSYVGLFGYNTGTIKNVVFIGNAADASGQGQSMKGAQYVGGLVGYNSGSIENCAVAGFDIFSRGSSNTCYVGGFVGYNTGIITRCSASNISRSKDQKAGGALGGDSTAGGVSYGQNKGGFVGYNSGNISYCYAFYRVSTENRAAGTVTDLGMLQGFGGGGYYASSNISNCYAFSIDPNGNVRKEDRWQIIIWYSQTVYFDSTNNGTNNGYYYNGDASRMTNIKNLAGRNGVMSGLNTAYTVPIGTWCSGNFPYPAVVKDANGNYVHYGNWLP